MSDHCVHSHRTYYLLHFNFRAASRTVTFEMGPSIQTFPELMYFFGSHPLVGTQEFASCFFHLLLPTYATNVDHTRTARSTLVQKKLYAFKKDVRMFIERQPQQEGKRLEVEFKRIESALTFKDFTFFNHKQATDGSRTTDQEVLGWGLNNVPFTFRSLILR